MIRVLHVIGAMDRAGAETMIMNYYRALDHEKIQFDFLVHTDRRCDYDDEIESLGGRIYRIPRFNGVNYSSYKKTCKAFFEAHPEIDIVHGHIESSASIYLPEAAKTDKITICHSHNTNETLSLTDIAFRLVTARNKRSAQYYMACSKQAGLDRFGESIVNSPEFTILPNAIDFTTFAFAQEDRDRIRDELDIGDKPVFGHIGRFSKQKNHEFLIEVFSKIRSSLPDAQLLLVGRGNDEQRIQGLVEQKGLGDSVHFLGIRNDVESILAALDVFLFPSLWEGLGVALIEAEASGLPCLVSDALPSEAIISPLVKTLSLDDPDEWAKEALASLTISRMDIKEAQSALATHGYEIDSAAQNLMRTYRGMKEASQK